MSNPHGHNPYPGMPPPGYGPPQGQGGMPGPGGPHSHGGYPQQPQYGHGPPMPPPPIPHGGGGTSKALPIIVSIGLAVGVFLGLLYVRGTGETEEASASPGIPNQPVGDDVGKGAVTPDAGAEVAMATPDAAPVSPPDAAPPEPKKATITFVVSPENAKVTVDKRKVDGNTFEVTLGDDGERDIRIEVAARGYSTYGKKYTITEDKEIEVSLRKRSSSGGGSRPTRPTRPTGPGGLIDLP